MGIKFLPELFKKTATGAIQSWRIGIDEESGATIVTIYGQVDGKKQETRETIRSGRNLGKKNQTSIEEQTRREAKSRWDKKKKSGYVGSMKDAEKGSVGEEIEGGIFPMLAKVYETPAIVGNDLIAVQPKLDGGRMIAVVEKDLSVSLWTRTRKRIYSMDHVAERLAYVVKKAGLEKGFILDGEAYSDKHKDDFESLMSAFRKERTTVESEKLQYHVYDCVLDKCFRERYTPLSDILTKYGGATVRPVETFFTKGEKRINELHEMFVEQGYEGAMIRLLGRGYEAKKRSSQLLKFKKFLDSEFKIVGFVEGRGRLAGHCGAFICEHNGEVFKAKMSGSTAKLKHYWENKDEYVGAWLTVQYQGVTTYGIPRFPVGLRIRHSEDT